MFKINAEEKRLVTRHRKIKAMLDNSYEPGVATAAVDLISVMKDAHVKAEIKWDDIAFAKDLQDIINKHAKVILKEG